LSYDLKLFHVVEDEGAELTYQRLIEQEESETAHLEEYLKRPVSNEARGEMRRLAEALKSWRRPTFQEFEPKSPLPWIELIEEDLWVQIHVYETGAGITVPYFGERGRELIDCVVGCIRVLGTSAGSVAYDPQLGRIVGPSDLDAMVTQYGHMSEVFR
jgi:hypothetical protein